MPLVPGTRLGPYEIVSPIGAGGMGEVYRARDTRLDRVVAVKVAGQRFTERFEREARHIAALNHPHICSLYDVGPDYLVMEYVDGDPIRPPGDMRKLLDWAGQIGDGLAAAHAAGIVHRDLKPDNILVTRDGRVKILDFGLAKQATAASAGAATVTVTDPGTVVGTVAYMSPEQARGRDLDARSDQFSFGLVVYELATGKRAFQRESAAETMTAIIREEPEPLPAEVPLALRWIVERCLAKDPADRYDTTRGLYLDLRSARERLSSVAATAAVKATPRRRSRVTWLLAAAAALLAGGAIAWALLPRATAPALNYTAFAASGCRERQPAWSPDGRSLAYICDVDGVGQVFTRALDSPLATQLTRDEVEGAFPAWSADGSRVYYQRRNDIYFASLAGGSPQLAVKDGLMPAVSPDGRRFAFFRLSDGGVWIGQGDGSNAVRYRGAGFPAALRVALLRFSPDSRRLAVIGLTPTELRLGSEAWILPVEGGAEARIPGFLFPVRMGGISWTGGSRALLMSLGPQTDKGEWMEGIRHLYELDVRSGERRALTSGPLAEIDPAVSPDGRRIATTVERNNPDIFEFDLQTGRGVPVAAGSRDEHSPAWAPSGREFAYVAEQDGRSQLWIRGESSPARAVAFSGGPAGRLQSVEYSPDGDRLALDVYGQIHRAMVVSASGGTPIPLDAGSHDSHGASFSPDGAWIVYTRYVGDEMRPGRGKVTKVAASGAGQPIDLVEAGTTPGLPVQWSPAGNWIAYTMPRPREVGQLRLVSPDGKAQRTLLETAYPAWTFDRSGGHILGVRRGDGRGWELWSVEVATGAERRVTVLDAPVDTQIRHVSLHPDGKRALMTVETTASDIWMIDGALR